jgi:hypothetical protein
MILKKNLKLKKVPDVAIKYTIEWKNNSLDKNL